MNLSDENTTVLEGGISNIKYIWRTEPNACEKCQELDGTEYNSKKDVPEKPHPNCKCYIEEVKDDDETCDCLDKVQNRFVSMFEKVSTLQANLHEINISMQKLIAKLHNVEYWVKLLQKQLVY